MSISWRNSEQYPDPTAYMALTAVERSEKRKHLGKRGVYHGVKKGADIRAGDKEGIGYERSDKETGT